MLDETFGVGDRFEELLKASRKARREDIELGEAMERLLASKDFQVYLSKVIGSRLESYGQVLLEPAGGRDGLVRGEFVKGAMFAFCLARDLPSVIVAAMGEIRSNSGEPSNG